MKKILLMLSEYLKNFWFTIIMLALAMLLMIWLSPITFLPWLANENSFISLGVIIWRFLLYFAAPLGVISVFLIGIQGYKNKQENAPAFWLPILIILIALTFLFIIPPSLNILEHRLNNIPDPVLPIQL